MKIYDVVIIGGGVSGAAQLYAASKYTDVSRVALIEKELKAGAINSAATNNSQTLHEGDIETNYNLAKATAVKHKASFTRSYLEKTKSDRHGDLYVKGPKMVLGVGETEVAFLSERFAEFQSVYPGLTQIVGSELAELEPKLMQGRPNTEVVTALYNEDGITVNYGKLAEVLIADAEQEFAKDPDRQADLYFDTKVETITKTSDGYELTIEGETILARYLSVSAGSHSMYFAKQLGLEEVATKSLLLVAGNFYYTPKLLNAKVYTVQNPKLPFSAVHGDPDILHLDTKTRYGPTTRIVAQLERGRFKTTAEYFSTLSPVVGSLLAYARITFDPDFIWYAFKHNVLFLIPGLGNYLFVREARKMIPTMKFSDLERAKGQGGVRPQIVATTETNPLNLGEAKLAAEGIRFNVTPSPGATTCVFNGLSDMRSIMEETGGRFFAAKVEADFGKSLD